jgi:hypothetical protein
MIGRPLLPFVKVLTQSHHELISKNCSCLLCRDVRLVRWHLDSFPRRRIWHDHITGWPASTSQQPRVCRNRSSVDLAWLRTYHTRGISLAIPTRSKAQFPIVAQSLAPPITEFEQPQTDAYPARSMGFSLRISSARGSQVRPLLENTYVCR